MNVDLRYHFPPDLLTLLIDTIPRLNKTKEGVVSFFRGAGVPPEMLSDLSMRIKTDAANINKYEIARTVLQAVNDKGNVDHFIFCRREIVKRVVQFEAYSTCWEDDQLAARGLVAQVQQRVNTHDSFIRIEQEREKAEKEKSKSNEVNILKKKMRSEKLAKIREALCAIFVEADVWKRGKSLEKILNDYFAWGGISVCDAFTIQMIDGKPLEQVDGVVELEGTLYLVEIKWWKDKIGTPEIADHLRRITRRGKAVRGFFISYSDFTASAVEACKEQYANGSYIALCTLQELLKYMEKEASLKGILKAKINAAIVKQKPLVEIDVDRPKQTQSR